MKRTLKDARREFEETLLPGLSDYQAQQMRKTLAAAEQQAHARARSFIEQREAEVRSLRDEALRELTEVRDEMEALVREGMMARIDAAEYEERLVSLRKQQEAAEAQLHRAEEMVETIAEIEQDPIAWADQMSARFPNQRKDLGW